MPERLSMRFIDFLADPVPEAATPGYKGLIKGSGVY